MGNTLQRKPCHPDSLGGGRGPSTGSPGTSPLARVQPPCPPLPPSPTPIWPAPARGPLAQGPLALHCLPRGLWASGSGRMAGAARVSLPGDSTACAIPALAESSLLASIIRGLVTTVTPGGLSRRRAQGTQMTHLTQVAAGPLNLPEPQLSCYKMGWNPDVSDPACAVTAHVTRRGSGLPWGGGDRHSSLWGGPHFPVTSFLYAARSPLLRGPKGSAHLGEQAQRPRKGQSPGLSPVSQQPTAVPVTKGPGPGPVSLQGSQCPKVSVWRRS